VRIHDSDLRDMNDLLKAKAGIDVTSGFLSYYSELSVRNDAIDGYVKVLLNDLDIYGSAQDKKKPLLTKTKEVVQTLWRKCSRTAAPTRSRPKPRSVALSRTPTPTCGRSSRG
jgi:hypothetical protein